MKVHFVGIGGSGMSGIAKILLEMGYDVTGSDVVRSEKVQLLETLGAKIGVGHSVENLSQPDIVVTSSAIAPDNVEVVWARKEGIPTISRAEMLGRIMASRRGIAVSGTHGKTTTTTMISLILRDAGLEPTLVIGGESGDIGSNAMLGTGDLMVVEADESDASFLHLSPQTVVVTNIEPDHMDHYGSFQEVMATFHKFVNRLPIDGSAVVCTDCPNAAALAKETTRPVITYGLSGNPDVWAENVIIDGMGSSFDVWVRGVSMGTIRLVVPGRHNIQNALAAIAVALHHDVPFDQIQLTLAKFHGAVRRFDVLGEAGGILVVDDYAHHPTEIRATLEAASGLERRIIAVFQPHRYTRTKDMFDEFLTAFERADVVVLTEIYAAFEKPIPGVSSEKLAAAMSSVRQSVNYFQDKESIVPGLKTLCRPGDLLLVMGAGDIRVVGERFLETNTSEGAVAAFG